MIINNEVVQKGKKEKKKRTKKEEIKKIFNMNELNGLLTLFSKVVLVLQSILIFKIVSKF